MKKNKQYRSKKQVIRNTKRSMNAKKRNYVREWIPAPNGMKYVKAHCPEEKVKDFEIGPSLVTKVKDGKTIEWNSWSKKNKQQPTKEGKAAMDANKKAIQSKKDRIKQILQSVGYDPTIHYTRKEKKRFTRAVKNNLFKTTTKTVQVEEVSREELLKDKMKLEALKNNPLITSVRDVKRSVQPLKTAAEMTNKETPKLRKFMYTVDRKRSDDPMRNYAFLTNFFEASTLKEAETKCKEVYKHYATDDTFCGVSLYDKEGDNSIIFYSRNKLLAA